MPDTPERALFDIGGYGINVNDTVGNFGCAGRKITRNHLGRVDSWTPVLIDGYTDYSNLLTQTQHTELLTVQPMYKRIEPYLEIYASALKSLNVNIMGMRQPVLLEGAIENNLEGKIFMTELEGGNVSIPTIKGAIGGYKTLDLGVKDNTQSLISVMDAMDREILTIMGIKNSGTEKMSGITSEETVSINQQLSLWAYNNLAVRKDWAKRISAELGINVSVEISDIYKQTDTIPNDKQVGQDV